MRPSGFGACGAGGAGVAAGGLAALAAGAAEEDDGVLAAGGGMVGGGALLFGIGLWLLLGPGNTDVFSADRHKLSDNVHVIPTGVAATF